MTTSGGEFQYNSGAMPPEQYGAQPTRPTQVPPSLATAIKLMYAGAALSLINAILTLFQRSQVRTIIEKQNDKNIGKSNHLDASQLDTAVTTAIVFGAVVGLIAVGLWILMAMLNKRGLAVARIVSTVLAVLSLLTLLNALAQTGATGGGKILAILISVVGVVAGVLLWRKDSSEFFNAHK